MNASLKRRLIAEFIGTVLLLSIVVGSGIMAEQLCQGNVAVALLANAVATGAGLYVLILMFASISGAHFNPIVTGVMYLTKQVTLKELIRYSLVQLAGALVGVLLAHAMFDLPLVSWSTHLRTGNGQWLSEIIATLGLILVILSLSKTQPASVPAAVGAYITAAYWFTASTSFANPAVTIARSLTNTFAGIAPAHVPMFVIAQCVGAVFALFIFQLVFSTPSTSAITHDE